MDVFALSKLIISSFNFLQANFQYFVVLGPLIPATSTSKRNYRIIVFLYTLDYKIVVGMVQIKLSIEKVEF